MLDLDRSLLPEALYECSITCNSIGFAIYSARARQHSASQLSRRGSDIHVDLLEHYLSMQHDSLAPVHVHVHVSLYVSFGE